MSQPPDDQPPMSRRAYRGMHEHQHLGEGSPTPGQQVGPADDPYGQEFGLDDPYASDPNASDHQAIEHYAGDAHVEGAYAEGGVVNAEDEDWEYAEEAPQRRSPVLRWAALLGAVAVVAIGGLLAWPVVSGLIPTFGFGGGDVSDYSGPGSGEISIEVPQGAGGGQIAEILATNDVVASASAFTAAAAVDPRGDSIQPGSYLMAEQMSAEEALKRMLDPEFRQDDGVTVREGLWKEEVFTLLARETGNEVADYEAVDPAELDLPQAAGGKMEGYLFPDTYRFKTDASPTEQLAEMISLGKEKYADLGLEGKALDTAVVKGSLIQAEGTSSDDLPKIGRVIENRLAEDQPLEFDSTVHFIFGERGRVGTTDKQRSSNSAYNTYRVEGLPPGPINSPGVRAIEASLEPADGPWLYFVTTNPSTGKTKFSEDFEGHERNVAEFKKWCRDNPDDC